MPSSPRAPLIHHAAWIGAALLAPLACGGAEGAPTPGPPDPVIAADAGDAASADAAIAPDAAALADGGADADAGPPPTSLIVAVDGDDVTGDGTLAHPFATLDAALARATALRATAPKGMTILLRGGRYALTKPLHIGPESSGASAAAPLTFRGYPGETATLDGAYAFRDGACGAHWAATAIPTVAGPATPVHVFAFQGECRGRVAAALADVRAHANRGAFGATALFVGGARRTRARHPNVGAAAVLDPTPITTPIAQFAASPPRSPVIGLAGVDVPNMPALVGRAEAVFHLPFESPRAIVTSASTSGGKLWVSLDMALGDVNPTGSPVDGFQLHGYLENAAQFLDAPGEWWFDEDAVALYYVPYPGEDLTKTVFELPLLEQLVVFDGVSAAKRVHDVHFAHLTLAHTAWRYHNGQGTSAYYAFGQGAYGLGGAIDGNYVAGITISAVAFAGMGEFAVSLGGSRTLFGTSRQGAARDVTITGTTVDDAGAGAYRIDDRGYPATHLRIENNTISAVGRVFVDAPGIVVVSTSDTSIQGNAIDLATYDGISIGLGCRFAASDRHVVANNVVRRAMTTLLDGGAIYVTTQNVLVAGNNVLGTRSLEPDADSATPAIFETPKDLYLDDYASWVRAGGDSLATMIDKGGTNQIGDVATFVARTSTAEANCPTSLDGTSGTTPPTWW